MSWWSADLDQVRTLLFPELPPEEGRRRIQDALERAADPQRVRAIEAAAERQESLPDTLREQAARFSARDAAAIFDDLEAHAPREVLEATARAISGEAFADEVFPTERQAFSTGVRVGRWLALHDE